MSIIYEALKKVENKDKGPVKKMKKKFYVPFFFITSVIGITLVFVVFKLPDKKKMLSILGSKTVENQLKAPAFVSEPATEEKYGPEDTPSVNYVLEGIIFDEETPLAIINGKILKKNDKIKNAAVLEINRDSVELFNLETYKSFTLRL